MREILFRGKRMDNGAWVEGAFCMKDCDDPFGEMVDRPSIIKYEDPFSGFWFRVYPETVGQFTGLIDKNGEKIFEGDIVRYVNLDEDVITGSVAFGMHSYTGTHELGFYVKWQKPEWAMNIRDDLGFWINFREIEVIGNIHDNHDLLEGGSEIDFDYEAEDE